MFLELQEGETKQLCIPLQVEPQGLMNHLPTRLFLALYLDTLNEAKDNGFLLGREKLLKKKKNTRLELQAVSAFCILLQVITVASSWKHQLCNWKKWDKIIILLSNNLILFRETLLWEYCRTAHIISKFVCHKKFWNLRNTVAVLWGFVMFVKWNGGFTVF